MNPMLANLTGFTLMVLALSPVAKSPLTTAAIDLDNPGYNMNIPNVPQMPANPDQAQVISDALDIVNLLDPQAGLSISIGLSLGTLGINVTGSIAQPGVSDHDTITLRSPRHAEIVAVILIHEWDHVMNGAAGGGRNGHSGDTRTTDPCFQCSTHSTMNATSAEQLAALICEMDASITGKPKRWSLCGDLRRLKDAALSLAASCQEPCAAPIFEGPAMTNVPCIFCD